MHLGSLKISRFRSCDSLTIHFQSDLTVLVGENNGGKSNIIDAIRLLTLPLNGRRDRYAEDEDLRRGATTPNFELEAVYHGLSDTLKGLLIAAVPDPTQNNALFGYRFEPRSEQTPRGRSTYWAGRFDATQPEAGSTDLIRHVYLPPLRNAQQELGSASGARVMSLLRHFLPKDQEPQFLQEVRRGAPPPAVINNISADIGTALGELTKGVREQTSKIDFSEETLLDVARDLRFKLADAGMNPESIRASGLGYANLLYMSTVVVELAKAKDADLTLFLVEEPEAHLHPQLQAVVLEFLLARARKSAEEAPVAGQPEGRIQVIVTTHSPNLTAWVSPKHLVVVRSRRRQQQGAMDTVDTVSVPIAKLNLADKALNKVHRYLDVTRSAMLFGTRILLVEGIAEALLLPVIAEKLVLRGNRDRWLQFKATLLIPVDGVDFEPYVDILLRPYENARIADRIVVITDADPQVPGNRQADLEALADAHGARAALDVYVNAHTLEHELMVAGNEAVLKKAFLALHPNSGGDWTAQIEGVAIADRPAALLDILKSKRTRKGDFAQVIAQCIEDGDAFVVPAYLNNAIQRASS